MASRRRHITILMATRDGARFLTEQLASIVAQTHDDWALWVSDDGSTDTTLDILRRFRDDNPQRDIRLIGGPRQGAAQNFLSLLCHPCLPATHVALADQDDVWLPGKLARAIEVMDRAGPRRPRLYAAQSILTTRTLAPISVSSDPGEPSFANAMVQNLFAGHSIVLDPAALALVRQAQRPTGVPFHDWWLYLLLSGAGAACLLDPVPMVLYRQHGSNTFGASGGWRAASRRIRLVLRRDYSCWIRANLSALAARHGMLTPEARVLSGAFASSAPPMGVARVSRLASLGIRRQSRRGTAGLYLAAALGQV